MSAQWSRANRLSRGERLSQYTGCNTDKRRVFDTDNNRNWRHGKSTRSCRLPHGPNYQGPGPRKMALEFCKWVPGFLSKVSHYQMLFERPSYVYVCLGCGV